MKLVIYHHPYQWQSFFHSPWFESFRDEHFDIEFYQPEIHDHTDDVFVTGCNIYIHKDQQLFLQDRKVIVDVTWESSTGKWGNDMTNTNDKHLFVFGDQGQSQGNRLYCPNFFRYQEALWSKHGNYATVTPDTRVPDKKFLLPINRGRGWRLNVLEALESHLDESLWSCVSPHGVELPGYCPKTGGNNKIGKRSDTRYCANQWYDRTHFSIVLETQAGQWKGNENVFLTEKTYKPISMEHPFIIMGAKGSLKMLQDQGFKTFPELWDESYDDLYYPDRLHAVKEIVDNFVYYEPLSQHTKKKLKYNRKLYFNRDIIHDGLIKEFVQPIKNWLTSDQ